MPSAKLSWRAGDGGGATGLLTGFDVVRIGSKEGISEMALALTICGGAASVDLRFGFKKGSTCKDAIDLARNRFKSGGYAAVSAEHQTPSSSRYPPAMASCDECVHSTLRSDPNQDSRPAVYMSVVRFCVLALNMHWGK